MSFMVSTTAWNLASPLNAVTPAFAAPLYTLPASPRSAGAKYLSDTMANLTTLFGSQSSCECEHCQSVLSPAAYLVELIDTLKGDNDYFLGRRRPDIFFIHLNCVNTETKLPYIDLVNELLERVVAVASQITLDPNALALQTTLSAEELALRPENEYGPAYVILAQCRYPLSLPWDKWFEEARQYLEQMKMPLERLIEVLIQKTTADDNTFYFAEPRRKAQLASSQCIRAFLGLTVPAYDLITQPQQAVLSQLFGLWGNDIHEAENLTVFMRRLGLWKGEKKGDTGAADFILMREMLGTRYVQDSRTPGTAQIVIDFGDQPCNEQSATLDNITEETIVRVVKFERLRRALGWTPRELHCAIMVFGKIDAGNLQAPLQTGLLDEAFLRRVSHVVRISKRKKAASVTELLSWWGNMETGANFWKIEPRYRAEREKTAGETLYDRVFLDPSLYKVSAFEGTVSPERAYFELNEKRSELQYLEHEGPATISSHLSIVSAALRISEAHAVKLIEFMETRYSGAFEDALNLRNLSSLYRMVSFARYLGITLPDLLIAFKLIEIDPFAGVYGAGGIETEMTILFMECAERIRKSPFTIRDLAYLWQHYVESDQELVLVQERIENYLPRLREALTSAGETSAAAADSAGDKIEIIKTMLAQTGFNQDDIDLVSAMVQEGYQGTGDDKAWLQEAFRFLSGSGVNDLVDLLVDSRPQPFDDTARQRIIDTLAEALNKVISLGQSLAEFISAPEEVVRKLLRILKGAAPKDALLEDFFSWRDNSVSDSDIRARVMCLEKIAQLVNAWNLTAEEVEHIQEHGNDFYDFDWNRLPITGDASSKPSFRQWAAIMEYVDVRNRISLKKGDLIDLFKAADPVEGINWNGIMRKTEKVIRSVSEMLNVAENEVRSILYHLGYIEDVTQLIFHRPWTFPVLKDNALRNAESLRPVLEIADILKRSGRSFAVIQRWVSEGAYSLDATFPEQNMQPLSAYKADVVEQVRNTVKARSGEEQWRKVAKEIQDRMRIMQRDKLLDFITNRPMTLGPHREPVEISAEDVYDYLLIDPHMNPCMMTTRLKQAISSVQLYIHRILMGLEYGVPYSEDLATEWKWKKNYRVWEAYRKVFLYPENWIEPELRDNKTPFFKEFEDDLSQSELDDKTIEKAYNNYLQKIDEVSNLRDNCRTG